MVKIASFNCNSVRSRAENVKTLLQENDVLCLQELMLCKSDLPILNDFSDDFYNIAFVEDRESLDINEGRPAKGVAIFYRKYLSSYINPLLIDDSIIGLVLSKDNEKILLLNVYCPCDKQTVDALHDYRCMLAKIRAIVSENNVNSIIIVGDFNADPTKGRFWKELNDFVRSLSLIVLNDSFPEDTFTYLCPARNTTSWLDHVVCSKQVITKVSNLHVTYTGAIYDHFPVCFDLSLEINNTHFSKELFYEECVDWRKVTEKDKVYIREKLDSLVEMSRIMDKEVLHCSRSKCQNPQHLKELESVFPLLKEYILASTEDFTFDKLNSFRIIPGWNSYIKHYYSKAREAFLEWKNFGRPQDGSVLQKMKETRDEFRKAFNECKKNEDNIRKENMLRNLRNKNYKEFWNEANKIKNNDNQQLNTIDNIDDTETIAKLFSDKYKKIFDLHRKNESEAEIMYINSNYEYNDITKFLFSRDDVHSAIQQLKPVLGFDKIHTNHIKYASSLFEKLIAMMFSSFILHSFISMDIIKGTINPRIKDRFGDITSSENYRPVMSSSVFLKLFEYCLLNKIEKLIQINDRQHGFRSGYSTSTACFVLKETIHNYMMSNNNVYACFVDFSKAFDTVNHGILLRKLQEYGLPDIYIDIIRFWYCNQFVNVRYGMAFSEEWRICNGVRQGGVLSGLFFSIYIDGLLEKLVNTKIGCRLGIQMSNIIAYADDIVLLAPSRTGLQILIDIAYAESGNLELNFNVSKTKCMIFCCSGNRPFKEICLYIGDLTLQIVDSIKYLGFIINSKMTNSDDIDRARNKFYQEFNVMLRKFSFADKSVKLLLFSQYCLQFYGSELWYLNKQAKNNLKQFSVGYHKAIKKILGVSYHESNHYACQEAKLYTFEHLVNKAKILFVLRLMNKPCNFIRNILSFLMVSCVLYNEICDLMWNKYEVDSLEDNDKAAIIARICYVQNNESQLRVAGE